MQYTTMSEIKAANKAIGHHWFDPDTMRFFSSRIEGGPYVGNTFVTSEQPPHGKRAYTVRVAHFNGAVDTVGEMLAYRTLSAATAAAIAFGRTNPEFLTVSGPVAPARNASEPRR